MISSSTFTFQLSTSDNSSAADNSAVQIAASPIQNAVLPRRNGALLLVENDFNLIAVHKDGCGRVRLAIARFCGAAERFFARESVYKAEIFNENGIGKKRIF